MRRVLPNKIVRKTRAFRNNNFGVIQAGTSIPTFRYATCVNNHRASSRLRNTEEDRKRYSACDSVGPGEGDARRRTWIGFRNECLRSEQTAPLCDRLRGREERGGIIYPGHVGLSPSSPGPTILARYADTRCPSYIPQRG